MNVRKKHCFGEIVGRNMDVKCACDEASDKNKRHVFGNQRKGSLCYKVAKNLPEIFSSVLWKVVSMKN